MGRAGILFVGRAVSDMAIDDDQGRAVVSIFEHLKSALKHLQIVGVADPRDVPAVPDETRRHVIAVRQSRVSLDGDVVVVVDPTKIAELQVTGQ